MGAAPTTRSALSVAEVLAADNRSAFRMPASLVTLYALLAPACLVICATNGYDGSVLTGLQAVQRWKDQFGNPQGALLGFTSAAYPLGALLSTPVSPVISDRFGRRWSIIVGSVIMILGVLMQCLSKTLGVFVGGRIIVGFGITVALAAGPVLISELAHPRHRVLFGSLYNCSFYLGSLLAAWVNFGSYKLPSSWAWRLPVLIQAVPATLQILCILFLDESPRWLCYKNRYDEAWNILVRRHGDGNEDDALVFAEYTEMKDALEAEKQIEGSTVMLFFKTPANRKRLAIIVTLAVFGQWSGNGLVSYYLTKILSTIGYKTEREQTLYNAVVSTVNYGTALMAAFLSTKMTRRSMFIGGGIAMFFTFGALTISIALYTTHGSTGASKSALAFIFIYYAAFNLCLNPLLYLYPTEVLPFRLRAIGLSVLVFANKASLFFNQFVNPIGMDSLGWKYYLVYVCWIVVEVVTFYFLYPETKGYTLETIQRAFGEDVQHDGPEEKGSFENVETAMQGRDKKDE